ncbi:MAG: AIM24 family protein [Anaeromicrobium sp.]|jgi:uncharacterized protein (AIM24 family)|uniref:AIM24 family protein n=1 Tax=Anaeromicrobium sp. TaxID=1929132 RepID=UPI0025F26879|nr:AIM24 family protein [Anaeromicrobium sp.]MCT4595134.1 AIM24 family protein [Anaeromicrobium sp.]
MFNPDFSNAVRVIDKETGKNGTIFEIIEYIKPRKGHTVENRFDGGRLRQVRIKINDSGVLVQPGDLQFMKGPLMIEVQENAPSQAKGFFKSVGTGEASFTSRYSGKRGEIYLDPSYKYFYMLELCDEEIILGDGMFYCCEDSIQVSVHVNKDVAVGLLTADGFRQPKLSGNGIAILESYVPFDEILMYELNNDTLKVDGSLAVVIRGDIKTKLEKSKKEGLLQTFTGTGEVWLAPTKKYPPRNI